MDLFFTPTINKFYLPVNESLHCVTVLRHKRGDKIQVTDGLGHLYDVVITRADTQRCEYCIEREILSPLLKRNYAVHVAFAPTKNIDRTEWMIEKCVEIGINEFTPLICRYSERKSLRLDRLKNIIISASKQSLNPLFPILNSMVDFHNFVENCQYEKKYIAHCHLMPKSSLFSEINKIQKSAVSRIVLIGPEGDFSEEEISFAENKGFTSVSLSNRRLRTETAALVAGHIMCLYE